MTRTFEMKCGCLASLDFERWMKLCAEHEAEWQETHQRWAADHAAQTTEED